ncbi:CotH kinase family protein [bacterium]|nr:CotH kinase family protein [bacterium]
MQTPHLNQYVTSLFSVVLIVILSFSSIGLCYDLAINEFLASNASTATDQDGEYDDWIELYNFGSSEIVVTDFTLTDNRENLDKWTFPDTSIQAGAFLIVWVDNDEEQAGLHASFKLSASGEEIILSHSDGAIIDSISYQTQNTDISFGRFPNGTGAFQTMLPSFAGMNSSEDPPDEDITELLFDADVIHKFELRFYTENWQDSLEYNYEALDQEFMPARLVYNDITMLDSIGVRYKGNSSYIRSGATVKKPFKFKFDEYIDGQTLLGVERLNFSNSVSDPTFMREMIGYNVSSKFMPSPRAVYANIFVEDELIGLYIQVEQVDELFLKRFFASNDGNLYKASDDGATLKFISDDPSAYEAEYELKSNEKENDWSGFIDILDKLNNTPDESFIEVMSECLNLDGVISHLAFNMVFSSFDSYTGSGRNFYFYDDSDTDLFNLIPWDLNETFGTYTNNWNVITTDVVRVSNADDRPLVRHIMQNDSLRSVYFDRIREMIDGYASLDTIAMLIERYQPIIEEDVLADENKLYSSEQFFTNIDDDVRISLGQVIPGLKSFSQARNFNILAQITDLEVFPGDCDNNGVVDALDILPIGVYFQFNGSSRKDGSLTWSSNSVMQWYNLPATYADANGDGMVDEQDVIGISTNWGKSHEISGSSYEIDPSDSTLLNRNRAAFNSIYISLSKNNEAEIEIKNLLDNLLSFESYDPENMVLGQNYPNPFNSSTVISFSLQEDQPVTLDVFNLNGQKVITPLLKKPYQTGQHVYLFDASTLPSGIYFYTLKTAERSQVRKMTILK